MFLKPKCGICCFHPPCLQRCASISVFVAVISFTSISNQALSAYLATQITALERQFGFSSSQTGFIVAANDIGYVLFALLMGYIAPKVHIPRALCLSSVLISVAAFLCVVPYLMVREELLGESSSSSRLETLPNEETLDLQRMLLQISEGGNSSSGDSFFYEYSSDAQTDLKVYEALKPTSVPGVTCTPSPNTLKLLRQIVEMEFSYLGNRSGGVEMKEQYNKEVLPLADKAFSIISSNSLRSKIPREIQASFLLLARWRLKAAPDPYLGAENSVGTNIEELGSLQLMMLFVPYCSSQPKDDVDCELYAEVLNKGFTNQYTTPAFWVFLIAMFLASISKSPRGPMTFLYFDDNGNRRKTAMYVGILLSAHLLGAIVAFGIGVLASRLYVTVSEIDIHPENPYWIGAWWLGFAVIATVTFLTALPLMCFPKRIKPQATSEPCEHNKKSAKTSLLSSTKEFLFSLKRCLVNPVLMSSILAGVLIFHLVAASLPFAAKYMESQFRLPAWKANTYVGLTWALPTLLGSLVMGCLATRANLSPVRLMQLALVGIAVSAAAVLVGMFIGCDTARIVGFNEEFADSNIAHENSTLCSSACFCDSVGYSPVCGSNGRNYFSPCHAGCLDHNDNEFTHCQCIGTNGTGSPGLCEDTCTKLPLYMAVVCVIGFGLAACGLNLKMVTLRSVQDRDRAMAIAMASFLNNLLGWLPAPIIFGRLVDGVCMIWTTSCTQIEKGACALYDIDRFRTVQHAFWLTVTLLVFITICFAYIKGRNKTDWNSSEHSFLNTTIVVDQPERTQNDETECQTELLQLNQLERRSNRESH